MVSKLEGLKCMETKVPPRRCNKNFYITGDPELCDEPATHVVKKDNTEWFCCTKHALEAQEMGCRTIPLDTWFKKRVLIEVTGEPQPLSDYVKQLQGEDDDDGYWDD